MKLAFEHEPDFQPRRPPGRKGHWVPTTLAGLLWTIDRAVAHGAMSSRSACFALARGRWKDLGVTGATLYRKYLEAKSNPNIVGRVQAAQEKLLRK